MIKFDLELPASQVQKFGQPRMKSAWNLGANQIDGGENYRGTEMLHDKLKDKNYFLLCLCFYALWQSSCEQRLLAF